MLPLTPEQQAAVVCTDRRKKVVAGAGTGKTHLVVGQVQDWLDHGVLPETIAAVTFTRRAGEELRFRVRNATGQDLGFVGTIHAFCLETLWEAGHNVIPVDPVDLDLVIQHVADDMRLSTANLKDVAKAVTGDLKRKGGLTGADAALHASVLGHMADNRLVWVGDMLTVWIDAFNNDADLQRLARYRAQFVVWDEYQDSNDDEVVIHGLLDPEVLMVVGDPRQAIYQFRGADPVHMQRFQGASFDLTVNHRSVQSIVATANDVAPPGLPPMSARRTEAGAVDRIDAEGMDRSLSSVAALLDAGRRPVHILCRSNREVAAWGRSLERGGVRVHVMSSRMDPYSTPVWRDAYVAARWVLDPNNEWVNTTIATMAAQGRLDMDWLRYDVTTDDVMNRLLMGLPALATTPDPARQMPVADFVTWYSHRDLQDQLPGDGADPDVVIMTVHASKGLEFDTVLLADVGGRLGGRTAVDEVNLLYVGVTRARDHLVLEVVPKDRRWSDA